MDNQRVPNSKYEKELMQRLDRNAGKIQVLEQLARRSLPLRSRPRIVEIGFSGRWRNELAEGNLVRQEIQPIDLPESPETEIAALLPAVGKCEAALTSKSLKVIGFNLLGLTADQLEPQVETVMELQRTKKDFRPLFVTDCSDFAILMRHGASFEYIPPSRDIACGTLEYGVMKRRRIELIRRKWGLADMIDLGRNQSKSRMEEKPHQQRMSS